MLVFFDWLYCVKQKNTKCFNFILVRILVDIPLRKQVLKIRRLDRQNCKVSSNMAP